MPTPSDVIRSRRRRRAAGRSLIRVGRLSLAALAVVTLILGAVGLVAALAFASLTAGLPPVSEIEGQFGPSGAEIFLPLRFYDRSGRILLLELVHPRAADRRWLRVDSGKPDSIPTSLVDAVIASQDATFWTNPGYDLGELARSLVGEEQAGTRSATITERLVEVALLPIDDQHRPPSLRSLHEALLAGELTRRYPKARILAWYLNSVPFGTGIYGVDAASLVYFGIHATELDLAQSAMLAALLIDPSLDPIDAPEEASARQAQVLEAMVESGYIDPEDAATAAKARLTLQDAEVRPSIAETGFLRYAYESLAEILGPQAIHRSRLKAITSLDYDLQLQATCAAESHIKRLSGEAAGTVVTAKDGSACVAAGLLPPLRPGDAELDHNISDWAVLVMDPRSGEVLSLIGPSDLPRPAGMTLAPLTYLTAFARGASPGTMILDVPPVDPRNPTGGADLSQGVDRYHGPVRMRTALANGFQVAHARALELAGVENALRTIHQMGVNGLEDPETDYNAELSDGEVEVRLIDLAIAYSVVANRGRMAGRAVDEGHLRPGFRSLDPTAILRLEGAGNRVLYEFEPREQPVLSPQLAYLMADTLSDEEARWISYGQPNPLEVGRPAGVTNAVTTEGRDNWTIGFTPLRTVAVWIGGLQPSPLRQIGATNGAASIWHAVLRYASRELPTQGWEIPPGVNEVEVCDPSGLLPTDHCPTVVREVFVQGTEPISYDSLYQPFRVNRETEKLATLFTPIDLVEERVYLVPPPEAAAWAEMAGIERPPQEYDTLYAAQAEDTQVRIESPEAFETLRGEVVIRGAAHPEAFKSFRLQYGQGLNPTRWVQVGEDIETPIEGGTLGTWDTRGLSGLYTLQLIVILEGGQIRTSAVQVALDNEPPTVRLLAPAPDQAYPTQEVGEILIQAEASDAYGLARVDFYVDGRRVASASTAPYAIRWAPERRAGEFVVYARAYDIAGNQADSEPVTVRFEG